MVYGRYNELVFMVIIPWFINQHSHHWGAPSCTQLRKPLVTRPGKMIPWAHQKTWLFFAWFPVRNMIFFNGGFSTSNLRKFCNMGPQEPDFDWMWPHDPWVTLAPNSTNASAMEYGGWASEPAPVGRWFIHVYPIIHMVSTCFNHPRWCRISSIHSTTS